MQGVYRVCNLAIIFAVLIPGIGADASLTADKSWKIAQSSPSINEEQLLEVVVPSSTIVRLKQGGSYTGMLTAFNSQNLAIAANGFSETVPLSQIQELEFQGDVWIPTPEGNRKRVPIRGITIPLEEIPVNAFNLGNPPQTAVLNLETVLSQEEFERLSGQTEKIHVVKKILFESAETMTIRLVGARP